VPAECGAIRVDLKGNIYAGLRLLPKGFVPPAGFEKDPAYAAFSGSIVKFGPTGGTVLGLKDAQAQQPDAPRLEMSNKAVVENGLKAYPGMAPFSGGGYGANSSSCVCRVPRFDLDRFGRLAIPNCVTNSIRVVDNAGNLIVEFGAYGNFDSQWKMASEGDAPAIDVPAIPMGWPVGAGFSNRSIYICDSYNRRVVRVDKTWGAEQSCEVK
jgi:hypothetical protein